MLDYILGPKYIDYLTMLFCHLFTIVSQHQSRSQYKMMGFELFISLFLNRSYNMVEVGQIQIKMDNLLVNTNASAFSDCSTPNFKDVYQINCNSVFCFPSDHHYRFEREKRMVAHLNFIYEGYISIYAYD